MESYLRFSIVNDLTFHVRKNTENYKRRFNGTSNVGADDLIISPDEN